MTVSPQPFIPFFTLGDPISVPVGPPRISTWPIGCVCPPGANKECERPDCPRRNWTKGTT
jgi:hypothetical protein